MQTFLSILAGSFIFMAVLSDDIGLVICAMIYACIMHIKVEIDDQV